MSSLMAFMVCMSLIDISTASTHYGERFGFARRQLPVAHSLPTAKVSFSLLFKILCLPTAACRAGKTYGANYNAAAHLRRAHFNPPKYKRGGRGKKSEGRGGMGGGNKPSMDELKNWMFEEWEININGRIVSRETPVDEPVAFPDMYSVNEYPTEYMPPHEPIMMADMHQPNYPVMPTTMAGHYPMPAPYHTYMPQPVCSM